MTALISVILIAIFTGLSVVHVYWALGGKRWVANAIPEIDGAPAFDPSPWVTAAVAAGLLGCAMLVATIGGYLSWPVYPKWLRGAGYALTLILAVRAIGDFNLLGFTKRQRATRFARLDTQIYSPLCVVLAVGVFWVASAS